MLVAIHQPNLLPWLGWFDKLARADVLILLDNAAHPRGGSNHTNRVQILAQGRPQWITVPLRRGETARSRIDRLQIADDRLWRRKLRATIAQAYAQAPFREPTMAIVDAMLAQADRGLCEMNIAVIRALAELLGLAARPMLRASALGIDGHGTDRLVALVRAVGGDAYLSGGGAAGYQEDSKFAAAGIGLIHQDFRHPIYPQLGAGGFIAGLSAIDALMNCGPDAALFVGRAARPVRAA